MSKRETYEAKTLELLKPIAESNSVEIYDVEYVEEAGEWYLRAYIDKEGGVTINDCEAVSRALSDALDVDDFIDDAYYLEVSSPGLGRSLKKDSHLEKSIGDEVDLKTYKAINKQKEFTGILKSFDALSVTLEINGEDVSFARKDVANIKLTIDF
ncbi:MAG: ribosome maturation factor RimP [Lachnospiraceae bacterium]|nr:ribosome maturation factor RimP [Lachnospiraceae bacterium]